LAHGHNTQSPYHLPEIGTKSADKANRDGVAERLAAPAVPKTMAVDLALITSEDELRKALDLSSLKTAKPHDAPTLYLLHPVPGIGKMLSLVLRYASPDLDRFARGQACVASGRLLQWAKASAGNRGGPSGKKIGHGHLQGACADAATLCLRNQVAGQRYLAR
jgi:hypothetical protein